MELQQQIDLKKAAKVLRWINHPQSISILSMLSDNGPMVVTDIYIRLRSDQSPTSQRLSFLRKAGLVETERDGKFIRYSLNEERAQQVAGVIEKLGAMYDPFVGCINSRTDAKHNPERKLRNELLAAQ